MTRDKTIFLRCFPGPESERLFPHLELVPLPLGKALYESGDQLNHVYFPTTAIVSLLYDLENGASAEIAVVGNEGIVGIAFSWAAIPCRIGPWCRARATPIG